MAIETKILTFGGNKIGTVGGNKLMGYTTPPPLSISNLEGWFAETKVVSSGRISQWTDLSGKNNHFTNSNGAQQPYNVVGYRNGFNSVNFKNNETVFLDLIFSTEIERPFTFFIVCDIDNLSTNPTPIIMDNANTSHNRNGIFWQSNQIRGIAPNVFSIYAQTRPFNLKAFTYVSGLSAFNFFENNVLRANLSPANQKLKSFRLGQENILSTTSRLSGNIMEIIIYSKQLDSAEITFINNYLINKYGL